MSCYLLTGRDRNRRANHMTGNEPFDRTGGRPSNPRPHKPRPQPYLVTVRKACPEPGRRAAADSAWELLPPLCASERQEDLDEVRRMIELGEIDVAIDELRWLLQGCSDFIAVHRLLGELALAREDYPLARGHFGYAFRIGVKAVGEPPAGLFPYSQEGNRDFLESAKGLAWCLFKLDKPELAIDVVRTLLACDPSDPLGVGAWVTEAPH